MSEKLSTVKNNYEAFAEQDIATVQETLAEDVTWVETEGGPYGGTYEGPEEVVQNVFGRIAMDWDEFAVEPERYVNGDETVVAMGTYRGTYSATGEVFEAAFAHSWTFENGEVVHFEQFVDKSLLNEPIA